MYKYLILIIVLFIILSSNAEHKVEIIGADNQTKQIISDAINNTDKNVTKYIKSITVTDINTVTNICNINGIRIKGITERNFGCNDLAYSQNRLLSSSIYIVGDRSEYNESCNNFENTLYHEIGHTDYAQKYGYTRANTEDYADNYANIRAKDECN